MNEFRPPIASLTTIKLTATDGEASLSLRGGLLLGWVHRGQPMLRAAVASPDPDPSPLASASFPLVPYSNRIADARFVWNGAERQLRRNFPPEPHAIHGTGWTGMWQVEAQSQGEAVLVHHHRPDDDWPWPFTARQHVVLEAGRLTLRLEAWNTGTEAVPLAFGHHPYFEAAGARLRFGAARVWSRGADGLPGTPAAPSGIFDFASGPAVAGRALDHGYDGWNGRAEIRWAGRACWLEMVASPSLPSAVVYIPEGGTAFCFEPVPHGIDALNRAGAAAMPVVEPGGCFTAQIVMTARQDEGGATD